MPPAACLRLFFPAMQQDRRQPICCSELGRSLRQPGKPLDATGTDHNPYGNSLVLGGKSIVGGNVFGATDFTSSTEELSGAHLGFDPSAMRNHREAIRLVDGACTGRPPPGFVAGDYLSVGSVVNTILDVFGHAKESYWPELGGKELARVVPGVST